MVTHRNIYRYVGKPRFVYRYRLACTSLVCQLRSTGSNNTPIATGTPITEILVSNTILQQKEPEPLREMFIQF